MSTISINKGTTVSVQVTVSGITDLTGYTCHFVVKKRYSDATAAISKNSIDRDGSVFTFTLAHTDTAIAVDNYVYEASVSNNGNRYVIDSGTLRLLDSLKW